MMRVPLFLLARLGRDRRGTSIIEFALAAPVMAVMLMGLVDVASCYSAQMSIQQAAARSLERLQASGSSDTTYLRAEAATAAGVPLSQVTVDSWLECDDARQAATVTSCSAGQTSARYVQVTITSSYEPFFGYSPVGTRDGSGNVALSAASALRVA